jgi:hypothetical protein
MFRSLSFISAVFQSTLPQIQSIARRTLLITLSDFSDSRTSPLGSEVLSSGVLKHVVSS